LDKILVVDDEVDILSLVKLILETEGYGVITSASGDRALELIQREVPDLVVLDLLMPGKSGLEVCRILRNQGRTKHVPIVVLSALGREVDVKLTKEAGADAHLTKPFTRTELLGEVRRCLREARTWKFSQQLGVEHKTLVGRKILLEFDPTTGYERVVRDFALECAALGNAVYILTRPGSSVRETFKGDNATITLLDLKTSPSEASFLDIKNLTIILDSLTDLALYAGGGNGGLHKYILTLLPNLSSPETTALFLLNPRAHSEQELAGLRGEFNAQLAYNKDGLTVTRLA